MSKENSLTLGFSNEDAQRIEGSLKRLGSHLPPDKFVVVGSLAIRYHLLSRNLNYEGGALNDLDLIVEKEEDVEPSITKDFLVYHHHRSAPLFYFALVDPLSMTKIDIFTKTLPVRTIKTSVLAAEVNAIGVEDQLVQTAFDIQRISENAKVKPVQIRDAKSLLEIADLELVDRLWRERGFQKYAPTVKAAVGKAEEIAKAHPDWLSENPFRKPKPYVCRECVEDPNFPLAPMEEVYKILGHIE